MLLFHRDLGGAGLPPLVILHGLLGSSRNWQTVGRELSAQYHVFALDLRNHGSSPHAEPMTYATMADDVVAWLDAQSLSRITLLGHSLGGKTAMVIACRHPDRIERLIVVDIAPKVYRGSAHQDEFAAMQSLDLSRLESRAAAEAQMESLVPDWAMRKFLLTNLERATPAEGWKWAANLPALTAALPDILSNPLTDDDHFKGPVRFILGGKSRYVSDADWPAILAHFPTADRIVIAGAGHNPHIDARAEFVAAVLRAA